MAIKTYSKSKMSATGIPHLDVNNPFTPESASFAELLTDTGLDEGMVQYLNEKKARSSKKKRSIKGYPPVQETLDLHGEIAVDAERKAVEFIQMGSFKGLKTVRIITGKGLHSPGGKAVLPDVVEAQLVVLKRDGVVFDFAWDRQVKQKSGAVLVYLL